MDNKRIYLFDNLKFFLIICVVVGHITDRYIVLPAFQSIYLFIYAFHMPAFIFLSGLFHKNKDIMQKVVSFISIGVLMKIGAFVIDRITLFNNKLDLLSAYGAPWYMYALAVFILITYLFRNINKTALLIISFVVALFVGYTNAGDFLCLSRIAVFYPIYLLGTMVDKNSVQKLNQNKKLKCVSALLIVTWAGFCIFGLNLVYKLRPFFTARNSYKNAYEYNGIWFRLLCFAISALLVISLISLTPSKRITFISCGGTKTLQIYFWHYLIIRVFEDLDLFNVICSSLIGQILIIPAAIVITMLLFTKPFSYPTNLILKYIRRNNLQNVDY